jgi:hypothetical protein
MTGAGNGIHGHRTMDNLYTYVMRHDAGLAPNPFWGWCTLAVCTPNHQGSRVEPGDWIAGFQDKSCGYRLVYAMQVAERIHMNDYFHDPRFAKKKPRVRGTWIERCGDNFYRQDSKGTWVPLPSHFHSTAADHRKDTKHPWVFVGRRFWYLGQEAVSLPPELLPLAGGRGARVKHSPALVNRFKAWVKASLSEGVAAIPRDVHETGCGSNPPFRRVATGCLVSCS